MPGRWVRGGIGAVVLALVGVSAGLLLAPTGSPHPARRVADRIAGRDSGAVVAGLPAPAKGFAVPAAHQLTDVRYETRWAPVLRNTVARATPAPDGRVVASVSSLTPEGTADLVDADGEVTRDGETWVRARLAVLPDDTTGWIPRSALGGWSFVDTHAIIDLAGETLTLYRDGRVVFHAPVGVGGPGTPTPTGTYYVRDELTSYASPEYGPVAFGTSARSSHETDWPAGGFIGIHGTDQPSLIPGHPSHGCIRLRNSDILELARLMPVGTPVTIQ